jgi:hypothetical protein
LEKAINCEKGKYLPMDIYTEKKKESDFKAECQRRRTRDVASHCQKELECLFEYVNCALQTLGISSGTVK